jgi:hypothetical protein
MRPLILGFSAVALAFAAQAQHISDSPPPVSLDQILTTAPPGESWQQQQQQGRDYSPRALFFESHGTYLRRSQRYQPAIRGSYQAMRDAEVVNEPGTFDLDKFRFDASVPLVTDPDNLIYLGARFGSRHYKFSSTVQGAEDDTLYEIGVNLGWGTFLSDDLYIEGRFTPGIYSDLDGTLHSKDFKWYGNALLISRVHETLFLKAGVAYNETFEQVPVYPRLGLAWAITPQFRFDALAPEYVEFAWTPSAAWLVSVGVECAGDQFRTRTSSATGQVTRKQQVQELDVYLQTVVRFDDHFSLFGKLGSMFAGDYDFRDATAEKYNGTLDWNMFFEVGFGIDF